MADIPEGYKTLVGINPAEDHMGPFYYQKSEAGLTTGFPATEQVCNGIGTVHGGVLMAFADYTATILALSGVQENCATISFSSDFLAGAKLGDWVEGSGEVVKRTGSMTFVSGRLHVGEEYLLTFQVVLRRLKKPGQ
ncbi:MAG: PaaI family thioesterase [Halieaceae bacterium]